MTLADLGVVSVLYFYLFSNMCGRSISKGRLIHVTLNMDTRVLMSVETGSRRLNIKFIYYNLSLIGDDFVTSKQIDFLTMWTALRV